MNSVWMNPYQYRWCVKKQKSVENRKMLSLWQQNGEENEKI